MSHAGRGTGGGYTLVEVIVALGLLTLILGVSGVAVASLREPAAAAVNRHFIAARDSALRSGRLVTVTVTIPDTVEYHALRTTHVLFLPDGRVVGGTMDPLTGAPDGKR